MNTYEKTYATYVVKMNAFCSNDNESKISITYYYFKYPYKATTIR